MREEWREGSGQVPFLLAERAHSESARLMRAVKGSLGHSLYSQVGNLENITSLLSLFYAGSIDVVVVLITDY